MDSAVVVVEKRASGGRNEPLLCLCRLALCQGSPSVMDWACEASDQPTVKMCGFLRHLVQGAPCLASVWLLLTCEHLNLPNGLTSAFLQGTGWSVTRLHLASPVPGRISRSFVSGACCRSLPEPHGGNTEPGPLGRLQAG